VTCSITINYKRLVEVPFIEYIEHSKGKRVHTLLLGKTTGFISVSTGIAIARKSPGNLFNPGILWQTSSGIFW